jgi:hypothetical protein
MKSYNKRRLFMKKKYKVYQIIKHIKKYFLHLVKLVSMIKVKSKYFLVWNSLIKLLIIQKINKYL